MKIAYVSQVYPPVVSGVAVVLKGLAEAMIRRGHQVLVLTASDQGESYVDTSTHLRVVRMRSRRNPLRVGSYFSSGTRKMIRAEIRSFLPDVLHLHDPLGLGVNGVRAAREFDIPTIHSHHQLPWFVGKYLPGIPGVRQMVEWSLWRYGRWFNEQVDVSTTPTATIARELERHFGSLPLVFCYGVDSNLFNPAPATPEERLHVCERFGLNPDLPVILNVGRLDLDKGVHIVIDAAAAALRNHEGQLLIVGDGTQRKELERRAMDLGIADRTKFTGYVTHDVELPSLYRAGCMFVTASEIETQGLVLIEAMASGLPIVAVRATCIPEIVHDGLNGRLTSPGDPVALGASIGELLASPVWAAEMGKNARDLSEPFGLETTFDQHEQLYRRTSRLTRKGSRYEDGKRYLTGPAGTAE